MGFPAGTVIKNPPARTGDAGDAVQTLGREDTLGRKWQSAPVFSSGKTSRTEELAVYSPRATEGQTEMGMHT